MSLSLLPGDIIREIATYLPAEKVTLLRTTCRHINKSLSTNELWLYLFKRDFKPSRGLLMRIGSNNPINSYKELYLLNREFEDKYYSQFGVIGPRGLKGGLGRTNLSFRDRVICGISFGVCLLAIWRCVR